MTPGTPSVTVFAPATVANAGVGFDILGFAISGLGDLISVSRSSKRGVEILSVNGVLSASQGEPPIPLDPLKNTAGLPLLLMLEDRKDVDFGFSLKIEKGIPLGSGMGGSAASAVGAVVAGNALLGGHYSPLQLLEYALEGEALASGEKHADNVGPCLLGGLILSLKPRGFLSLPYPEELRCVVVHPEFQLNTRDARAVLKADLPLKTHVEQSSHLAAFVAGLCCSEFSWIEAGLEDALIEPQREFLIPGFKAVKKAALEAGVLGCSISGAGPSVFALARDQKVAERARDAMVQAFTTSAGLAAQGWVSLLSRIGARVV